jgi:peroxiredoxin
LRPERESLVLPFGAIDSAWLAGTFLGFVGRGWIETKTCTPGEFSTMRKLLLSLAVFALVASPAMAGKFNKKLSVGDKAPDFSGIPAYDAAAKQDASLSLADLKEDVVVLCFSGNHCPVVQAYEDRIIDFVNSTKGKPVKFVAVAVADMQEDKLPAIKEYTADKGSNYTYGYDETQAIGKAYGATNTPQFFVLDKDRKIVYMGALDDSQNEQKATKSYLKDAVAAALKGETPEVTETRPVGCGISYKRAK